MKICLETNFLISRTISSNCFVTLLRYTFYLHYHCLRWLDAISFIHKTVRLSHSLSLSLPPPHCSYLLFFWMFAFTAFDYNQRHCILWWYHCIYHTYSSLLTIWRDEFIDEYEYARQPFCVLLIRRREWEKKIFSSERARDLFIDSHERSKIDSSL